MEPSERDTQERERLIDLLKSMNVNPEEVLSRRGTGFWDDVHRDIIFEKLVKLDMSNLGLATIRPDVFTSFNFLERLLLNHNKLTVLPEGLFGDGPGRYLGIKHLYLLGNLLPPIMNQNFGYYEWIPNWEQYCKIMGYIPWDY